MLRKDALYGSRIQVILIDVTQGDFRILFSLVSIFQVWSLVTYVNRNKHIIIWKHGMLECWRNLSVSGEPPRTGWRQNDKLLTFRVPGIHPQRTGPPGTLYHMEHTDPNPAWALKVCLGAGVPPRVVCHLRELAQCLLPALSTSGGPPQWGERGLFPHHLVSITELEPHPGLPHPSTEWSTQLLAWPCLSIGPAVTWSAFDSLKHLADLTHWKRQLPEYQVVVRGGIVRGNLICRYSRWSQVNNALQFFEILPLEAMYGHQKGFLAFLEMALDFQAT